MAIASITSWLNSSDRDFNRGKALYEQYGDDRLVLTIIRSGSSNYHFNKLLASLEELNKRTDLKPKQIVIGDLPPVVDVAQSGDGAVSVKSNGHKKPDYDAKWKGAPEAILEVRNTKNKYYAEARKMFETARHLDSAEHRLEMALQILDKMEFVNESWAVIDEYHETGKVRNLMVKQAEEDLAELDLKALYRKQSNIKSYRSKAKAALAKATTPTKKAKQKTRIENFDIQLAEIERRINEFV